MKNVTKAALGLLIAAGSATGAEAATFILNNGSPYNYVVHNNDSGSGTTLALTTAQIVSPVTYSSTSMLDAGAGSGVASVTGLGQTGFANILVDPTLNFSVIQFKLEGPNGQNAGTNFDILLTFVGGATQTFLDQALPANSKFDILAGLGETISSVQFSDLRTDSGNLVNFTALKQVSFEAAAPGVPEPATWAMMLGGFGLMGSAMRRRRGKTVQVIA